MKISLKIIVAASLIISLTLLATAAAQYVTNRSDYYTRIEHTVNTTLISLSDAIRDWLMIKQNTLDALAASADVQNDPDAIKTVLESHSEGFVLVYSGLEESGKMLSNTSDWQPPPELDTRMRPWYVLAKKHDHAVITEPYIDRKSGATIVSVATRLTQQGKFIGVLSGDVDLNSVAEMIHRLKFDGSSYVFLFTRSGKIITHPDAQFKGKTLQDLFGNHRLNLDLVKTFQDSQLNGANVKIMIMPLEGLPVDDEWLLGMVQDGSELEAQLQAIGLRALIATVVSVIACALLLSWVTKRVFTPLYSLRESLALIRKKSDLTYRIEVTTRDEFADLSENFNVFLQYLQHMVYDIKQQAHDIRENSNSIMTSSQQTSQQISIQTTEVDHLSTAMGEMVIAAESVASNANRTADAVVSAENDVISGVEKISGVMPTNETLSEEMIQAVGTIDALSEVSAQIGSIVTSISEISEQTNLLALNASIEAARAGEAGRGFAVVADEVRALANKTQHATEEIDAVIRQLQDQTTQAQRAIEQSQNCTDAVRGTVTLADSTLTNIRSTISEINAMTASTAAAVEQQSATTYTINDNTRNLQNISKQLFEASEDQTNFTQQNAELTHEQDRTLNRFRV